MNHAERADALCGELLQIWLGGNEADREAVSRAISALTQRPAFAALSLSERALQETAASDG